MSRLQTITSVSGGKTSAYLAANYTCDDLVFSLVRIEDKNCLFPDKKIRQLVEDRIQAPFIGTAEDDTIIYTLLDLEQFLGRNINWVTGITFDKVISEKGGLLPNKHRRYCTTWLKIDPIFKYWQANYSEPVIMNLGYRANEMNRAKKLIEKKNEFGFCEYNTVVGIHETGRFKGKQKWESIAYQVPNFPLIQDGIYRDQIHEYWKDKPVRFAERNNCVGCFHRNPVLLRHEFDKHPHKMQWFANMEAKKMQQKGNKTTWREDASYTQIANMKPQLSLMDSMFSECDSGFCEIN